MTLGTERSHNLHLVVGGCNNSNNNNKLLSASLTQYLLMVHFGSPCRTSIAVQNVSRILSSVSEDLHPEQTANLVFRDDHLSGKPGNVREFDSCQGNVRDFTKSQGNVREISCQGKVA